MCAVDFVVELKDVYLFVEVKDPANRDTSDESYDRFTQNLLKGGALDWSLVLQFRDTFLYRWAEKKLDKPVCYVCLIELRNGDADRGLLGPFADGVRTILPCGDEPDSWKRPLAKECIVTGVTGWNKSSFLSRWPVTRV